MILVVSVCRERLHYYEFVKPVEDVLKDGGFEFESLGYKQLSDEVLTRSDKVVICGTSLADDEFVEDIEEFDWLKDYEKPVLGICAGFQILGLISGGKLKKSLEIGFFRERFDKDFLGMEGEVEVYHLHGNCVEFSEEWEVFAGKDFAQAVKRGDFYGVLFHPEVRNRNMILEFVGLWV